MTPTTRRPEQTIATMARLLRHAADQAFLQATAEGPQSPGHLLGLGIQIAADDAEDLLAGAVQAPLPTLPHDSVRQLLVAAESLAETVPASGSVGLSNLRARLRGLVREATA